MGVVGWLTKVKAFPSLFSERLAQDGLHLLGNDCEVFCLGLLHLNLWPRGCCALDIIEHAILLGILHLHGPLLVLLKPTVKTGDKVRVLELQLLVTRGSAKLCGLTPINPLLLSAFITKSLLFI